MVVRGSSGVAVVWGIHQYLKHECQCHVSWEFDQLNLPEVLPKVSNLTFKAKDAVRFYQNVCNYGYGFVWWTWNDWERHIDWMALNGFNLVLAQSGQEFVMQETLIRFRMSKKEVHSYFTGPAFLPWNRMGNLRGWGGPLTDTWIQSDRVMQHRILGRLRSLGVIPVTPAFNGIVPPLLIERHLNSSLSFDRLRAWGHFPEEYTSSYLLNPIASPLFRRIGLTFQQIYEREYGTDHFFSIDTFNEQAPPSLDVTYLQAYAREAYGVLSSFDHSALWVMQGWMFRDLDYWTVIRTESFLRTIPLGRVLILDLASTTSPQFQRLNSYFGQPFIYCMLHNYGGYIGMYGKVETLNRDPFNARHSSPTMVGLGLTNEGMYTSYAVYDFFVELTWRSDPLDSTSQWFADFSRRRYRSLSIGNNFTIAMGASSQNNKCNPSDPSCFAMDEARMMAWQLLATSVYNCCSHLQPEKSTLDCASLGSTNSMSSPSHIEEMVGFAQVRQSIDPQNDDDDDFWGGENGTNKGFRFHGKTLLTQLPGANLKSKLWYDESLLIQAWDLFIWSIPNGGEMSTQGPLAYDVVDNTRQVLTNLLFKKYSQIMNAISSSCLYNAEEIDDGVVNSSYYDNHYLSYHQLHDYNHHLSSLDNEKRRTRGSRSSKPSLEGGDREGGSMLLHDFPKFDHHIRTRPQVHGCRQVGDLYRTQARIAQIRQLTRDFLALISDIDRLLGSNEFFLLGRWLEKAKARAGGHAYEEILFEFNARNQVTLWGPNGNILDYAAKQWSGLIGSYYLPRWRLYFDLLLLPLRGKRCFFIKPAKFKKIFLRKIGRPFTFSRRKFPIEPRGNAFIIAKELHTKYRFNYNDITTYEGSIK
ncbi:alpha-N-acetylglucosaminidase-like [Tigriopus californicus]|uniref:alpha-N-acetylglucosaminidase-like n=1 Tax=Tigriopus californicus TaxID=6832 RepID=UPI0027DA43FE|nr:alpha-N-acetylglucosaminidase-like [Tigriopus californicus]